MRTTAVAIVRSPAPSGVCAEAPQAPENPYSAAMAKATFDAAPMGDGQEQEPCTSPGTPIGVMIDTDAATPVKAGTPPATIGKAHRMLALQHSPAESYKSAKSDGSRYSQLSVAASLSVAGDGPGCLLPGYPNRCAPWPEAIDWTNPATAEKRPPPVLTGHGKGILNMEFVQMCMERLVETLPADRVTKAIFFASKGSHHNLGDCVAVAAPCCGLDSLTDIIGCTMKAFGKHMGIQTVSGQLCCHGLQTQRTMFVSTS